MNLYKYLPRVYNHACFLADHYDLFPYNSKIHKMVWEWYPKDEDNDASAINSTYNEDEDSEGDEVLTVSVQPLESSTSHVHFVFGSFESLINPVPKASIKPKFDGFSNKIGEISCILVDSSSNVVMTMILP